MSMQLSIVFQSMIEIVGENRVYPIDIKASKSK
jgi:hypothetical protein